METTTKVKSSASASGAVGPASPKLRRRPLFVVLAVALVAAGGLLGVWLWLSASSSSEVVVARANVERGHVIMAADLTTVRVALDPALMTVPAGEVGTVVGKRAASDLTAGTLLAPGQVTDQLPPTGGQSVVGIPVAPGLMPSEPLRAGDTVRLVQTPGQAGEVTGKPVTITATVLSVVPGNTQTVVDVEVSADRAAELAARAATGKVAIVLDSRTR